MSKRIIKFISQEVLIDCILLIETCYQCPWISSYICVKMNGSSGSRVYPFEFFPNSDSFFKWSPLNWINLSIQSMKYRFILILTSVIMKLNFFIYFNISSRKCSLFLEIQKTSACSVSVIHCIKCSSICLSWIQ